MAQQRTARTGKLGSKSDKGTEPASKKHKKKGAKDQGPASKAQRTFIPGNNGNRLVNLQVHPRFCKCVPCLIKMGNEENAERIAKATGHRLYGY